MSATGSYNDGDDVLEIVPKPGRFPDLVCTLQKCLDVNKLAPALAGTAAGKSAYVTQTVFGKVGRAATKAPFARQHAKSKVKNWKLVKSLERPWSR